MQARDKADEERSTGPLKKADDAIVVDTTKQTPQQTLEDLVKLVKEAEQKAKK